jgi:2-polyprenyl-3-methyl-5-hydroxy-6-metoxy-1,4-benzoquinol methylase
VTPAAHAGGNGTEPCQVCGGGDIEDYVRREDGYYVRCRACGLVWNPEAGRLLAEAGGHYDGAEYFGGYAQRFERKLRAARRRLDLVAGYVARGRLLDIGCGMGDTLVAAREAGYEAVGLDIGAYPVQHCAGLGFEVHQASITETGLPDESFDVVTMWDVLEHIPRSAEGLREVRRVLRAGGVAAIIAPNGAYLKAHLLRRSYKSYGGLWAKTHFVYHTSATLTRLLRDCDLEPLRAPVLRAGVLQRGTGQAAAELLLALPRRLALQLRSACRMDRNVFVVARRVG